MNQSDQQLAVVADALELAASHIRGHMTQMRARPTDTGPVPGSGSAVGRALALHPRMGHRQMQIIDILDEAGLAGTDTGRISRRIGYDQPNVFQALDQMAAWDFVEKDTSTRPHTYRLGPKLRPWSPVD